PRAEGQAGGGRGARLRQTLSRLTARGQQRLRLLQPAPTPPQALRRAHPRSRRLRNRPRRGGRRARLGANRGLSGNLVVLRLRGFYSVGMALVIASQLRKELSGWQLFDGVSFKVERRDRIALSGPNGAGKTTLLRILNGETDYQGGELVLSKGTRVALHDQRPPLEQGLTLREYVLSGASDLVATEEELRTLEQQMAAGAHDQATLRRYADAQARLEHAGGYAWRERAASVVRGLGFAEPDLDRSLETFSGGELTRASLARALGGDPDLLLLDEPTNHLDVNSLEWLERELQSLDAGIIIVAHDRWFLEAVTTAVLELEAGRSTYFAGPWHDWRRERTMRLSAAEKESARISEDIERLERFVARFRYKKSLAKRAQSKLTQIGRLEKERSKQGDEIEECVWVGRGGARRRLALAHVVASGANFLVRDGPPNHLDLEAREALEAALEAFPGTILLVSHDRALVDAVAHRTFALEDATVRSYDGGWAEYIRRRDELAAKARGAEPQKQKPRKEAAGA